MAASSSPVHPVASPLKGTGGGRSTKPFADALRNCDRAALEEAIGKGDTWARSVIAGDAGIRIDDLDATLDALGLKAVSKAKRCVDPALLASYETIVRRVVANAGQSLFDVDAE